jgi:hypothetical protein
MKNKFISLILVGLVFGMTAFAATTVSLSPVNVSVKEGQSFNLVVSVNPQSVKNYTVKLEIKYPANTLEVKSFSFGNNWMALAQPGYDSIDNSNGVLIKTAGYPGGLNSNASFGTIVFKAKKSGDATIQVSGNSLALNADNQNVISGLPVETFVTITPVVPSVEQEKAEEITLPITQPLPEEEEITTEEVQEQLPEISVVKEPSPLLAAISNFITLGTGNNIVAIAVFFVIALIIYLMINAYFAKKKNQVGK